MTQDEVVAKCVEWLRGGASVGECARRLGRHRVALARMLRRHGVEPEAIGGRHVNGSRVIPPTIPPWQAKVPEPGDFVAPVARAAEPACADVERLVRLCRGKPQSLSQLCDALDLSPRRVRDLLEQAKRQGYSVDVAGDALAWREPADLAAPQTPTVSVAQTTGGRFLLGVCSDLHFGSKYCMREQLADYVQWLYGRGVRVVLVAGDILDGCYRHGMWELSHHGWDEQAQDCFASLPQHPGLSYYYIDGNHDQTSWEQTGAVSGQRLQDYFRQNGRDDIHYLGAREGNLSLRLGGVRRPIKAQLWHPKAGKAYAESYQLQKRIEAYGPGTKPDLLAAGHWHTSVYLNTRGIHAVSAGCFQSPLSAFARSLVGGVSNGGWLLSLECTETGTLRTVGIEWRGYYHAEQSRALDLAAAS